MTDRMRSPFGTILREERQAQSISQAELAKRIQERFESDPSVADLGVVSDRAIANIEAAKASPEEFVRPRPETVRVLMLGLGIDPTTKRGQAMLRAASATQRREKTAAARVEARSSAARYQHPFVVRGRENHWASLEEAWETARTGQPQIRLIEGSSGLGKTRLIEEFLKRATSNMPIDEVLVAIGECSSGTSASEPYLPWRRAVSYALRSSTHNEPITPRDGYYASALLNSVSKLGGVLIDLEDLHNYIAARAPEQLESLKRIRDSWSPTNTTGRYDEFVSVVSMITREIPAVVVLEDLHWADESTCSLLLHLQRQMRLQTDMPLLVIGTYRSTDLVRVEKRHPLLHVINEMQRQVESVVLSLEPSQDSTSGYAFVCGLVDTFNMPQEDRDVLIRTLYDRTEGHPLFTSELIQRMVETGAIHNVVNDEWGIDRDKLETSLPSRMRAIIDERIQRLPDDARTIVESASVQGSPFTADVLPAVTGLTEAQVDLVIDRELMEQHRIFRLSPDGGSLEYVFDHAVICETVYDTLSPHRRRSLHRRTAEAIMDANRHNAFAVAHRVAHHYERANMPVEAAEQALISSFAALAKLDHDLTLVWVERSEHLARAANDDVLLWKARVRRANVLRSMGMLDEARGIGQEAIPQAQRLGDSALEADAYEVVALVNYDLGQLDEATEAWVHSIELYELISRKDRVSANQSMLSHVACRSGRLDAAIRHAQAAWAAAPDATRDGLGAEALLAEGNALLDLGRYRDAITKYEQSLCTYEFTGEVRGIILCRMNIALANMYRGKIQFALDRFDELQEELSRLQTPRLHAYVWLYQGKTLEAAGNYKAAKYHYQQALATRNESGLDAMAGDDLAGILRSAVALDADVEFHLNNLQTWWRNNDPGALEDPLLAMLSLVMAYEKLGKDRLMTITLNEGTRMFLDRADQIQNPAIRDMYLRGNRSGTKLMARAQEAGLVGR